MKQDDKELLLRDLCGRLPYGVKVRVSYDYDTDEEITGDFILNEIDTRCKHNYYWIGGDQLQVAGIKGGVSSFATSSDDEDEVVKPYLFPLSSMTKEQKREYHQSTSKDIDMLQDVILERINGKDNTNSHAIAYNGIDWLNAHHFDYRGLIEKGLAIDATGLNIYKEETK